MTGARRNGHLAARTLNDLETSGNKVGTRSKTIPACPTPAHIPSCLTVSPALGRASALSPCPTSSSSLPGCFGTGQPFGVRRDMPKYSCWNQRLLCRVPRGCGRWGRSKLERTTQPDGFFIGRDTIPFPLRYSMKSAPLPFLSCGILTRTAHRIVNHGSCVDYIGKIKNIMWKCWITLAYRRSRVATAAMCPVVVPRHFGVREKRNR